MQCLFSSFPETCLTKMSVRAKLVASGESPLDLFDSRNIGVRLSCETCPLEIEQACSMGKREGLHRVPKNVASIYVLYHLCNK